MAILQILPIALQTLCLDLIVKFLINISFEHKLFFEEWYFQNFWFGFILENSLQIFQVPGMRVDQKLIFREIVIFIALDLLIDIKAYIGFNDIKVPGLDNFQFSVISPSIESYQKLKLWVVQEIETLQENISVAPDLQDVQLTVQDDIGGHELGEPGRAKVNHVSWVIFVEVE